MDIQFAEPFPWIGLALFTLGTLSLGIVLTFFPHRLGVHGLWRVEEKLFGRRWVATRYKTIGIIVLFLAIFGSFVLCYAAAVKMLQ